MNWAEIDKTIPWILLAMAGALGGAYGARALSRGRVRFERVERQGASLLLSKSVMEAGHWGSEPVARTLIALGCTANGITLTSAALGAVAGGLIARGWFGIGAGVATVAALLDMLDGMVARASGTASAGGKVLDSALDRYVEFFFLAGVAVHFRHSVPLLALALFALLGSFMVSYATALAEIQKVSVSRGLMRRPERLVCLLVGATLTPALGASWPILGAVGLVAIGSNATASLRIRELVLRLNQD